MNGDGRLRLIGEGVRPAQVMPILTNLCAALATVRDYPDILGCSIGSDARSRAVSIYWK
jgi:hypothetical protein